VAITGRPQRSRHSPAATPNQRPGYLGRPRRTAGPTLAGLARLASLRDVLTRADESERRRLYEAGFACAYPVVFQVVTRKVERARGHHACARGIRHLAGECLDGFHDDVEALVEHLFASTAPIDDLGAWLAFWAPRAAVDGHRRRRGERGALQRPRMTKALQAALGSDPWLMDLALRILTWVGIPTTAGAGLWPLEEWAQSRAEVTGDPRGSTPATVEAEVGRVLGVLSRRTAWFARHVERPLGLKPAPVAAPPGDGAGDPRPLVTTDQQDVYAVLLAADALAAIDARLRCGGDPVAAVVDVLTTLFLGGSGAEELSRPPGAAGAPDERLSALLSDPAALSGVVERILRIVREG
jgi:hypothetical protein